MSLSVTLRRYFDGPLVRPLALAGPVFVLLIALPLLRPLRHPSEMEVSRDESLRMATVRALVEHHALNLDSRYAHSAGVYQAVGGPYSRGENTKTPMVYSAQPPMMALLLAPPAWLLTRLGYSLT